MPSVSWISPPAPRPTFLRLFEGRTGEQVAADDREVGRRVRRLRLLDHAADARVVAGRVIGRHDSVAAGLAARNLLHADDAAARLQVAVPHLGQHRHARVDQVVGQVHEKWLVADHGMRAQHGMAEAERRGLADVDAGRVGGQDAPQQVDEILLTLLRERRLQLRVGVEMVFDGALGTAGDEHQQSRTRGQRFLRRVLDEGLVDDRQHLLRARLGGGKEARAASGDGKHRKADRSGSAHGGSFGSGILCGS